MLTDLKLWTAMHDTVASHIDINEINDYIATMQARKYSESITIRNLDPAIKERLRIRAAQHGHSMEAEARLIIRAALTSPTESSNRHLYDRIRARFAPLGGVDLDLPPREPAREPPRID